MRFYSMKVFNSDDLILHFLKAVDSQKTRAFTKGIGCKSNQVFIRFSYYYCYLAVAQIGLFYERITPNRVNETACFDVKVQ